MSPEEKRAVEAWSAQLGEEDREALRKRFYEVEPGIWCMEPTDMADPMIFHAGLAIVDEAIAHVEELALFIDMRSATRRMDSHTRHIFRQWLRGNPQVKHIAVVLESGSFRFVLIKYFFSVMRYKKFSLSTSTEQALKLCRAALAPM